MKHRYEMTALTVLCAGVYGLSGVNVSAMTESRVVPGFCSILSEHRPDEDVRYKPDESEGAVPADLPGVLDFEDQVTVVPVEIDLIERYGLHLDGEEILTPAVAFLSVHPDGRVSLNGKDITTRIHAVCLEGGVEKQPDALKTPEMDLPAPEEEPEPPEISDGQSSENPVKKGKAATDAMQEIP